MSESIYRVTEVIGTSTESWEDAAKHAVETAAATLRDLRVGEVVKLDVTIDDGHVTHYRARVAISFKYEHAAGPRPSDGRAMSLMASPAAIEDRTIDGLRPGPVGDTVPLSSRGLGCDGNRVSSAALRCS
jgi:flavin-binding protein dodecin